MKRLPRISIGVHALRRLPLLDVTHEDYARVLRRRPPAMDAETADLVFLCRAIERGWRHIDAWTLLDVSQSLGWA